MAENQNQDEVASDVQIVQGVPVSIVVCVGPGVLQPDAPKGAAADVFLHDGCVHSLILHLIARCGVLAKVAYATALEAGRQEAEKEKTENGPPSNSNLVA